MVAEGLLDTLRIRGSDALVDGQCLLQVAGGFAGVAVVQVGPADSFQGACLLQRGLDVAGDGQRLAVVAEGLLAVRGPGR
jgi:hypothetical protein